MKPGDFIGEPCECHECFQAGIAGQSPRRDPRTGEWLHGYALKRWYEQFDLFRSSARAAVGERGRHGKGFEPLVKKP